MSFRIDVYTAGGVRTNGTAIAVSGVSYVQRVNAIGEISFEIPAVVALANGFSARKKYRVYHEEYGEIGYFRQANSTLNEDDATLTITAQNALADLDEVTVGNNYQFSGVPLETAVSAIVARAGAWTATYPNDSNEYYEVSRRFMGDTVFRALSLVAEDERGWFALNGNNSIKFGRWTNGYKNSAPIAATLVNIAKSTRAFEIQRDLVAIEKMTVKREANSIVNRIIAVGKGSGESQLDLEYCTRTSPHTVTARLNPDGKTYQYYIENADSIAEHGLIERLISFDVAQVSNSIADRTNAANVLYDVASAYLDAHLNETVNYAIACMNPPAALTAGSVVVVDYRAVAPATPERVGWVITDKGSTCYERIEMMRMLVTEVNRTFDDATGAIKASLVVSPNGESISGAVDRIVSALDDVKRFKTHVLPSYTKYTPGSREVSIKPDLPFDWYFPLDNDIAEINRLKLYFTLSRLRNDSNNETGASSETTTASAPATTSSAGGSYSSTTTQTSSTQPATTTTSGPSSAVTTEILTPSAVNNDPQAGIEGNTGYAEIVPSAIGARTGTGGTTTAAPHDHDITYHYHKLAPHKHGMAHTHTNTSVAHSHTVTIVINIPPHDHGIPAHSHGMAHKHPTLFGVFEDGNTPFTGVRVYIEINNELVQITNLKNALNGQFAGNAIDGHGFYYADLRPYLESIDFHGMRRIRFTCAGGHGRVHGQLIGSVTVVPVLAD